MAKYYDISLWEYITDPGRKSQTLEELALKYLDMQKTSLETTHKNAVFSWMDTKIASSFETEELHIIKEVYKIRGY